MSVGAAEKRPLHVALGFALVALVIVLRWPPQRYLAITWTACIVAVAGCLLLYEHRLRVQRRPVPALRWIAFGLVAVALGWYVWAAA